jgi:hypothetical protein
LPVINPSNIIGINIQILIPQTRIKVENIDINAYYSPITPTAVLAEFTKFSPVTAIQMIEV